MRIISVKKLNQFWTEHHHAKAALEAWYGEASRARWQCPQDIRNHYSTADFLADNRVVFNIRGNHYRLVVQIHYNTGIVYIRFVGTHAEYDRIDAERI